MLMPRLMPMLCPHCGAEVDCHEVVTGKADPGPSDVSICFYCRNLSMYVTGPLGLYLRKPTTAEYDDIVNDPNVTTALHALAVWSMP